MFFFLKEFALLSKGEHKDLFSPYCDKLQMEVKKKIIKLGHSCPLEE